jgi:hypothetical protein
MGEERNVYGLVVGKPEGKRPLGISGHTWADDIKMDFREGGVFDRIGLAQRTSGELLSMRLWTFGFVKHCEVLEWLHNWWSL